MRLTRVHVDGFKCLADLDWRPAEGLNLILGPNEAGKSTLADFIEAVIFGLPGGARGEEFRPWSGGGFGGRLEFDCDKTLVVIERDFGNGDFSYQETDRATGRAAEPLGGQLRRGSSGALFKRYRELFARHLGFFDEKLFRRSTFVPQGELVFGARDLSEAAAALRSLASGGGSAYDRALERLEDRYYALTSEGDGRRKPGNLDVLREESAELAARLREGSAQSRRLGELRGRIEERRADLERLGAEAERTGKLAERLRERAELGRRRTALGAAERATGEKLQSAERIATEAAEVERRLAAYADLGGATSEFPELVARARHADARVARLGDDRDAARPEPPAAQHFGRNLAVAGAAIVLGAAVVVVMGVAATAGSALADQMPGLVAGVALTFAGLVAAALIFHSRRSAAARARDRAEAAGGRRTEAELAAARAELKTATAALMTQAGGRVDFTPQAMEEIMRRYSQRLELAARGKALEAGLLEEEALTELRSRSADAVREMAVLDARIEKIDAELQTPKNDEGPDAAGSTARAAELARLVEKREAELHRLELELAALSSAETASAWAGERLEELKEIIPRHEARCGALRLALKELAESLAEFQESHLARLAELAGGNLAGLTCGRYRAVSLEADSLVPAISGAGRERVGEASLSQGTRAALYLALRLAMGKLVSGGRTLPLVLDDPLVDLDDGRRAAALELLKRLGSETQVLLLSFDRRLAECGAPVLELG